MKASDRPIQQKLINVIMVTSGAVTILTCIAFFAYDVFTFRQTTLRQLLTLGEIISNNSTAALACSDARKHGDAVRNCSGECDDAAYARDGSAIVRDTGSRS